MKKPPKGMSRYDYYLIEVFLKEGKDPSKIDVNVVENILSEAFDLIVREFEKRGLTSKLRVRISK